MQSDQYSEVRVVIMEMHLPLEHLVFVFLCEEEGVLEYVGESCCRRLVTMQQ